MAETKRSVLITGASGQLGHCLKDMKPDGVTLHTFTKADLDITNKEQIDRVFGDSNFDFFVNCAAFTGVDNAESQQYEAYRINAEAVNQLASVCSQFDTSFIQLSSDYVYDNGLNRPLIETDHTQPNSVYAKSKLKGDAFALEENSNTIVLRTSWLYSEYGHNFVKTMLRLSSIKKELHIVSDQHGIPTYARDLAGAIFRIVLSTPGSFEYGVYHFANLGFATWDEFARTIFDMTNVDTRVIPIETKDYPTPAKRPLYSVLDSSKFATQFTFTIRHWRDALDECLTRIALNSNSDN